MSNSTKQHADNSGNQADLGPLKICHSTSHRLYFLLMTDTKCPTWTGGKRQKDRETKKKRCQTQRRNTQITAEITLTYDLLKFALARSNDSSFLLITQSGPYIAGGQGGGGQLPPPGKLTGVKTKRPTRNPVGIREIPVNVCGVWPRRQKILGTALI